MALEMPVIASDFPLYRDVVQRHQCGICVDPQSADQLAEAIERLVRQPEEAAAMGRRGRAAVLQHYNWDTEYQRLRAFYEQLLQPGRTDCS
jgi:glycosyltransferase involved in cell wall biosynthesis